MSPWVKKWGNNLHGLKPVFVMVLVQCIFALVNVLYKLAANDGMHLSILVAYRFMFGAAFIVPVAFFVERKNRPKITWRIVLCGFLSGLFGGSLGQNLYLRSLVLTSATFSSSMTNLIPAITFLVAIILRLEKLSWKTAAGKAKVYGTILGIGGAMILTFYKGPGINVWDTRINLLDMTSTHGHHQLLSGHAHYEHNRFLIGALLALASCIFYSFWLITQAKATEMFPCPYSITAMMALSASCQGFVFALCVERDWTEWRLGWDVRLFAVAITGILGSGLMFTCMTWCVKMRGPLFVSAFQPLMSLMVAICGSLFMQERLHLGIVIGAILIVSGLYVVLWGKSKEFKKGSQLTIEGVENQLPMNTLCTEKTVEADSRIRQKEEEINNFQTNSEIAVVNIYVNRHI